MSTLAVQSTPTLVFVDRPPTPRPYFIVQVPPKTTSYHSLRSPALASPAYSYFSRPSNPSSPFAPAWDINVISPSVASFYSDADNDTDGGFQSPRLALQTSNLLGRSWQERSGEEETYTPISEFGTPIEPFASDEHTISDRITDEEIYSPRFEDLTSNFLENYLHHDNDELYTPISPSAPDDQDGDGWIPSISSTSANTQPPRLALLTNGHFQPDTWAFHTPLTPPEAAQQFEDDLAHDSARIYTHSYNHARHASELYTPISPSPHDYMSKFTARANDSQDHHQWQSSQLYTPISASVDVQQGWKDLLFEIMTPAERFFVPGFEIERASAPAPIDVEVSASEAVVEVIDAGLWVESEEAEELARQYSGRSRSASLSSVARPLSVPAVLKPVARTRRHSIGVVDQKTRQEIAQEELLTPSVFKAPASMGLKTGDEVLSPASVFENPLPAAPLFAALPELSKGEGERVPKPRRHSFSVLDSKLRKELNQAVVLTSSVYVLESEG